MICRRMFGWLRNQNLPQQCVIAPILEDLGWQETKDGSVDVRSGAARTSDMGVSLALGAAGNWHSANGC